MLEPDVIECEECGYKHKSSRRFCPQCGLDRFHNPDDRTLLNPQGCDSDCNR